MIQASRQRAVPGPVSPRRRAAARSFATLVVTCLLGAVVIAGAFESDVDAALPPPVEVYDPTPRVLGPISVIGDSVLRGSLVAPPHLVDRLAEQGWGPIRALGVPGLSTGHAFRSPELTAAHWFDRWRQQGWDPKAVALIIGANDVGLCPFFDASCMSGSLRFIVDHIGAGHDIFVPHINHWYKNEWSIPWNNEIDRIVAERANVHTWAWDVELATGGYELDDVVHLTPNSYRRWSQLTAGEVTAALGRAKFRGDNVTLPAPTAAPARLAVVGVTRLADTRTDPGGRLGGDREVLQMTLPDHVPDSATAVVVYAAATRAIERGYLQVAPCGARPPATSVVNYATGRAQGASTVVALDATREICVYASGSTDVVVDLQGVFVPGTGSALQPIAPIRRLDTRVTGRSGVVEIPVDEQATAVALNVTATNAGTRGYLTAYPCGQPRPTVATVNFTSGSPTASSAFIATDATHTICVFSSSPVDVVVDQTGTFTDGAGLSYVATTPTRVLDTRFGIGGWVPFVNDHRPVDVVAAPAGAAAVTGTIVALRPFRRGYLSAFGCGVVPSTSSVNAPADGVVANGLTVETSPDGRLCVAASDRTHAIVDITGWWIPGSG